MEQERDPFTDLRRLQQFKLQFLQNKKGKTF